MRIIVTFIIILVAGNCWAQDDLAIIKSNIEAFSEALMNSDSAAIFEAYTQDGKIMPNNTPILEGESLRNYWAQGFRNGQVYFYHKVSPIEIKILGEYAYDYGYYEGESGSDEKRSKWKGKYIIIWKYVEGDWKIHLDIWNRVP